MAWSKNILNYPPQFREIFDRLLTTGEPSVHTFSTKKEASYFERTMMGVRWAYSHSKGHAYETIAPGYVAERVDELTVRLCSNEQTTRARLGSTALKQRRDQDNARGLEFTDYAPIVD